MVVSYSRDKIQDIETEKYRSELAKVRAELKPWEKDLIEHNGKLEVVCTEAKLLNDKALKEIGTKIGNKDWNFGVDPCSGKGNWNVPDARKAFVMSSMICDCSFNHNSSCHVEKQVDLLPKLKKNVSTLEGVPRLFDLVKVQDERMKLAFFAALRNTVVTKDLDQ
ncbi:hypothetical protein JHK85_007086 [Glycine max]|nr:hypothetical protein JHK85_007086 [Glycine max]